MSLPNSHNGGPPIDDELTLDDREGWVRISRRIRGHWMVGFGRPVPPMEEGRGAYSRAEAWIDLLMECAYDGRTVNNNGRRMEIRPGQILGAVSWLSRRWNWTPKTVRGFLDGLEEDGMITVENPWIRPGSDISEEVLKPGRNKGKLANVLTVCKYAIYQLAHRTEGQVERQVQGGYGASSGPDKGDIYKEEQSNKVTIEQEKEIPADAALSAEADDFELEEESPAKPLQNHVEALDAFTAYNELAQRIGLPMARSLTPQRRKNLMARLREHGGMEAWGIALANIERSAFLRGNNPKSWTANFDFMLQASSFAKLVDGVYGNGAHANSNGARENNIDRISRKMELIDGEMPNG
jgi:hypothetical protein